MSTQAATLSRHSSSECMLLSASHSPSLPDISAFEEYKNLSSIIEALKAQNAVLSQQKSTLEGKLAKKRESKKALQEKLSAEIAQLKDFIEKNNAESLKEECEIQNELLSSLVLLQSVNLSAWNAAIVDPSTLPPPVFSVTPKAPPAAPPMPNFTPPALSQLKIIKDYTPRKENFSSTSTPLFNLNVDVLRSAGCNLKQPFREYIWPRMPGILQTNAVGWVSSQIKEINNAVALLKAATLKISILATDKAVLSTSSLSEILSEIKTVGEGEDQKNWEDLDLEWEDEIGSSNDNSGFISIENCSMLSSMVDPRKFRNTHSAKEYIERLQLLCEEKHKQLERSLTFLNVLIQKRIQDKTASAFLLQEAYAAREEEIKKAALHAEQLEIQLKIDKEFALETARECIIDALPSVQKSRLLHELQKTPKPLTFETATVKEIAAKAHQSYVTIYIQKLHNHPEYLRIEPFSKELEEGFLSPKAVNSYDKAVEVLYEIVPESAVLRIKVALNQMKKEQEFKDSDIPFQKLKELAGEHVDEYLSRLKKHVFYYAIIKQYMEDAPTMPV